MINIFLTLMVLWLHKKLDRCLGAGAVVTQENWICAWGLVLPRLVLHGLLLPWLVLHGLLPVLLALLLLENGAETATGTSGTSGTEIYVKTHICELQRSFHYLLWRDPPLLLPAHNLGNLKEGCGDNRSDCEVMQQVKAFRWHVICSSSAWLSGR